VKRLNWQVVGKVKHGENSICLRSKGRN